MLMAGDAPGDEADLGGGHERGKEISEGALRVA